MKNITKTQYEALELMHLLVAGILFLAGLGMAFNALDSLFAQQSIWERGMGIVDKVIMTGIVLLAFVMLWKLKGLKGTSFAVQFWGRSYPFQDNSYMENSVTHAMHYSWLITLWSIFLSLALLRNFILSPEFYLLMVGAVMLISWSLAYLIRYLKESRLDGEAADE